MAWSRPFFGGAFFSGGFFGGTGTTAGFKWPSAIRSPDELRRPREGFGLIPQEAMRAIAMVAKRYADEVEFDERELRADLVRELRLRGFHSWSSDYLDAALEERERLLVEAMTSGMRLFRIATCPCGASAGWSIDEGQWEIRCPECGSSAEPDDRPVVALRNWNNGASSRH